MAGAQLIPIQRPGGKCRGDVIFVHGLEGDAQTTWRRPESPRYYFPSLIAEVDPNVAVWSLDYPIHITSAGSERTLPLSACAKAVLAEMNEQGIGKRPIVAVCHSYGGLLIQQVIRHAEGTRHSFADNLRGLALFGTPNIGSPIANWVRRLSSWFFRLFFSAAMEDLTTDSPVAAELRGWMDRWFAGKRIKVVLFVEAPTTLAVVSRESAVGVFVKDEEIPLFEGHIDICKPTSSDELSVRRVRRLVSECFDPPFGTEPAGLPAHIPTTNDEAQSATQRSVAASSSGYNTASFQSKRVLAILSGELPYTVGVSAEIRTRLREIGNKHGIEFDYDAVEGPSDALTKATRDKWQHLIANELRSRPETDCFITIGTQASEMVKEYLGPDFGKKPFIFLAVSDPLKAGLVEAMKGRDDSRNVAGVAYAGDAIEIVHRINRIVPNKELIFAYQTGFRSDKYTATRLEELNHGVRLKVRRLKRLPSVQELNDSDAIYFSGYTFERVFQKYARFERTNTVLSRRLVVTSSPDYVQNPNCAIAAVGCDDDDIGAAGTALVFDFFVKQEWLGRKDVDVAPLAHWLNSATATARGIAYSSWGLATARHDFGLLERPEKDRV